jgi:hypothetical protein
LFFSFPKRNSLDQEKEKASLYGLCLQKYKWAEFRKTKAGVKLHFRLAYMDDETVVPEKVILTPAKKNDRSQLDALVDEVGLTYVYDRGYIDYARFDDYCDRGVFFVTRTKKNAVIRPIESFTRRCSKGGNERRDSARAHGRSGGNSSDVAVACFRPCSFHNGHGNCHRRRTAAGRLKDSILPYFT